MTSFADKVRAMIQHPLFQRSGRNFDRRELIKAANSLGPTMRLLHWAQLQETGQIPAFDQNKAENALSGIDKYGAPGVEIFMLSHRWLRPSIDVTQSHPDDSSSSKARAIIEFTNWRRRWVQTRHGFVPQLFYWIDYSCLDRRDMANNITMLPLWVACCERVLCFETDDYHSRAWCRLELLLSHVFGFADHQTVIDPGFRAQFATEGREQRLILEAPSKGDMTDPIDLDAIRRLEALACSFAPRAIDRSTGKPLEKAAFGNTAVKRFHL